MSPKPAKTSRLLRCAKCGARESTERDVGPKATGAENSRVLSGPQGPRRTAVYHIRCASCNHEWWSYTPRAKTLSREADARAGTTRPARGYTSASARADGYRQQVKSPQRSGPTKRGERVRSTVARGKSRA